MFGAAAPALAPAAELDVAERVIGVHPPPP